MKATTHLSRNGRRACQPDAPLNTTDLTTHFKLCECRDCLDAFAHAEAKREARLVDVPEFAGWRTVEWLSREQLRATAPVAEMPPVKPRK